MPRLRMTGGFIGSLGRTWSILLILGILVVIGLVVGLPLGLRGRNSSPGSPQGTPTTAVDLGFSMSGVPSGCGDKLGCQNTTVALTITPNNVTYASGGTISWTIKSYSKAGGIYNNQGSVPVTSFGNSTSFNVTLGNGNMAVISSQIKVYITKGSMISSTQYYNYTV